MGHHGQGVEGNTAVAGGVGVSGGAESLRALRGSEDAERGPLSTVLFWGGNGDRGKAEGAEGAESLNALRGVSPLKEASVISGFQWGQWFSGRAG